MNMTFSMNTSTFTCDLCIKDWLNRYVHHIIIPLDVIDSIYIHQHWILPVPTIPVRHTHQWTFFEMKSWKPVNLPAWQEGLILEVILISEFSKFGNNRTTYCVMFHFSYEWTTTMATKEAIKDELIL